MIRIRLCRKKYMIRIWSGQPVFKVFKKNITFLTIRINQSNVALYWLFYRKKKNLRKFSRPNLLFLFSRVGSGFSQRSGPDPLTLKIGDKLRIHSVLINYFIFMVSILGYKCHHK